jgi:hypothetical protein
MRTNEKRLGDIELGRLQFCATGNRESEHQASRRITGELL